MGPLRMAGTVVAVGGAMLCTSGCDLTTPSSRSTAPAAAASTAAAPTTTSTAALVARANRTHEYPAPAPRQTVVGGWRSPVQAVEVFADTYINWTATTVSDRLQALAEVSVGQARAAMSLAASETAKDYELRRSGVGNSGTVEAIAPLPGTADRYVVVTREATSASASSAYRGLAPAWHVSLATVARITGGLWVLSGWQPES